MTDTPDLKALSEAVKKSRNTGYENFARLEADLRRALSDAYQSDQLFTAADVEAAVRKEREACAMVADYSGAIQHPADGSYNGHQPVMGPDVAAAIRARTPIPD